MHVRRAALNRVEQDGVDELDDRRSVLRDPIDREGLFPLLVLADQLEAEVLRRLVQHALRRLALLEDVVDRGPAADLDLERQPRQQFELVELDDVGRVGADDGDRLLGALLRDERVAEHPLDRDRAEEVRVDAERRDVHVGKTQPLRERNGVGLVLLLG